MANTKMMERKRNALATWAGRLSEARKLAKISQVRLAEMVGASQSTIADYETARSEPNLDTFSRLSLALKCDVKWLVFGSGPMKQEEPKKLLALFPAYMERAKRDTLFAEAFERTDRMFVELDLFGRDIELIYVVASRMTKDLRSGQYGPVDFNDPISLKDAFYLAEYHERHEAETARAMARVRLLEGGVTGLSLNRN